MRKPDEIMAEYLLKGGKMLAKTCPDCSSPLFEIKGETICVVCREEENEIQEQKITVPAPSQPNNPIPVKQTRIITGESAETLDKVFALTIRTLLIQAQEEKDTARLNQLMKAIKTATESYAILSYGYGSRDNS
jgi:UPF0148 protein